MILFASKARIQQFTIVFLTEWLQRERSAKKKERKKFETFINSKNLVDECQI